MTGLAGLLLSVAWMVGANGGLIARHLASSELAPSLAKPIETAAGTWVVFHHQEPWARAFYAPPEEGFTLAALVTDEAALERLLPGLEVPRIFLYAPYYRDGGGLLPLVEMAVDVAEAYFNALLVATLDRELWRDGSTYRRAILERAEAVMAEAPEPQRVEVYLGALSDFGSHLLSVANEIARADRRARARGRDLCGLLDPPLTLFALWRQSIRDISYRGRYRTPPDLEGGAVRWLTTRRGLEPLDKALFLEEVLGGAWTGEPARDFAHLCR